jgi:hypothetical protein
LAHDALLRKQPEEAARKLDDFLAGGTMDLDVLTLRASVALSENNVLAALACVNRASGLLPADMEEPPIALQQLRSKIYQAMFSEAKGTQGKPPDWTWPPATVMDWSEDDASSVAASDLTEKATAATTVAVPSPAAPALPPAKPNAITVIAPAERLQSASIVPTVELVDAKIIADPAGQWAVTATAGTKYGKTQYSPAQATGAPNISVAGNSPDAWCPASKTDGTDWLEVSFAKPVHATEVRVRQNDAAGAIIKVEAVESDGTTHLWWEGVDPYKAPAVREIVWFAVRLPKTSYLVAKVKITLNLAAGPGWKEIDAVQLVGAGQ